MVDQDVIATRLDQLLRSIRRLARLAELPEETFLQSEDDRDLGEHHLRIALEACLDAGNHLIASEGFGKPQRMRDIPALLGEAGVIDQALAGRLCDAVTLRNRLVHAYVTVDHALIYRIIRDDLDDLREFARAVATYCE